MISQSINSLYISPHPLLLNEYNLPIMIWNVQFNQSQVVSIAMTTHSKAPPVHALLNWATVHSHFLLVSSNHKFVLFKWMDLPIWDISHKWNHRIQSLWVWFLSLGMLTRLTYILTYIHAYFIFYRWTIFCCKDLYLVHPFISKWPQGYF